MNKKLHVLFIWLFIGMNYVFSQTPTHYPNPVPTPIAKSLTSILFYIGIPLLIVVIYLLFRRNKTNRDKDNK